MTDREMADLFAAGRTQALGQVRAPGVEAVHRTVRRRRRLGATAAACAVLVTALGSAALLPRLDGTPPAPPIDIARNDLDAGGTVVIAESGQADAGYTRSFPAYLGNLTVQVSCAGTGRLTLVVDGVPEAATGQRDPVEQTRVTTECGTEPTGTLFAVGRGVDGLTVRLDDVAAGAAFAYRITTDTGVPITPGDPAADPVATLAASGVEATGHHLWVAPSSGFHDQTPLDAGTYRLVIACAGAGTLRVEFVGVDGTAVTAGQETACGWPARQAIFTGTRDSTALLSISFQPVAGGVAPARVAWAGS
ncbi:hypothetical protein ACIA8K_22550 [Catenuloplanes sp. NPDC051500]|uniref:hypothetical protein n=1 Tax=Catenuloplanes sp. NPDC051500 TaxID=3363959 RepID=UPI00379E2E8C